MIKCLIVDDEPLACELILDHVNKTENINCLGTFTNPIEAIHFLDHTDIDLIFLDVQMPELTGIQFMKIVQKKYPIIMTTAYENFAVDGFEFDVIDYLLKPIEYDRFLISLQKFKSRTQPRQNIISDEKEPDFIFVKSEYKTIRVLLNEIYYIEGFGDYLIIHTAKEKIYTLETLKQMVQLLPNTKFCRVHKSFIIALAKIDFIERNEIEIKSRRIPIGETYRKSFWEKIE